MNSTLRLIGYHITLFSLFSLLVILAFYISEGGDLDTPAALITYYVVSAVLTYIPLLLILTCFNFIVLAIGLRAFSRFLKRCIICFLPLILFALWFTQSENNILLSYYSLTDFQFYIILAVWFTLLIIGTMVYSGMKQYSKITLTIAISLSIYFLLQKYHIYPSSLMLTDFQFKTILTIWAMLNCLIIAIYRTIKPISVLETK